MEKQYSIYEAKAKLSELIRLVKRNYKITITERGQPVAVVSSYKQDPGSFDIIKHINELKEAGYIKSAVSNGFGSFKGKKIKGGLKRFLESRDEN